MKPEARSIPRDDNDSYREGPQIYDIYIMLSQNVFNVPYNFFASSSFRALRKAKQVLYSVFLSNPSKLRNGKRNEFKAKA